VVQVYSGGHGTFSLYGDAGAGLGYTKGQFTETRLTDSLGSTTARATTVRVTVAPSSGHYRGEPSSVSYRLDLVDLSRPSAVTVDGHRLRPGPSGSSGPGWTYQAATATVVVRPPPSAPARGVTVVVTGSRTVDRSEPSP
jgi:hypothetical protein